MVGQGGVGRQFERVLENVRELADESGWAEDDEGAKDAAFVAREILMDLVEVDMLGTLREMAQVIARLAQGAGYPVWVSWIKGGEGRRWLFVLLETGLVGWEMPAEELVGQWPEMPVPGYWNQAEYEKRSERFAEWLAARGGFRGEREVGGG